MAHVAGSPPPHPIVAMPPHAWSTEHHHPTSQPHRLSLPAYPNTSPVLPYHPWTSSHQDPIPHHLRPSIPSDLTSSPDPTDHHNADAIFRDLLNLRISTDTSPEINTSLQPQLPIPTIPASSQHQPHQTFLHRDLFSKPDPESDYLEISDHFEHAQQSLKRFPNHFSSLPFVHNHPHHSLHDLTLSDPLSTSHRPPFAHRPPFTSLLVGRRQSSRASLFRTSSVSDHSPRTSNPSRPHPSSFPSHPGPRIKNDLYKTEICRSFAENGGFCKYGSKCQFAHGEEELRPVRRHPRYKTKLCRNFVNNGSCPYATRCRFIHANDLPSVSVQTISDLHQSSISTAPTSEALDQVRYDGSGVVGEDYADNLRRILNMTAGSSAVSMTVNEEPSVPLPSSHASQPAKANSGPTSDAMPGNQLSGHEVHDGHAGKESNGVAPADHVFHANAFAFRDYPDGAFSHPYIPLASPTSGGAFGRVAARDVKTSQGVHVATTSDLDCVFRESTDLGAAETRVSGIREPETSQTKLGQRSVSCDSAHGVEDDDLTLSATKSQSTSSTGTRGRLPVFRNITSGGDSA